MKSRFVMLLVTIFLLMTLTTGAAGAGDPWGQQAKLIASDGANGSQFGWAVALDADTALVGVVFDASSRGSAYVFTRVNGAWSQQAKLLSSTGSVNDWFANAVAVDGDTALIGNPRDDASTGVTHVDQGSVYVFTRRDGVWSLQSILVASDGAEGDFFGSAVALDGDTALIGTYSDDSFMGSAYVFTRANGEWSQQAKLTASNRAERDYFGISVALNGDTALIGAHGDNLERGAAYVFTHTGTVWSQQAKLTASDGAASDQFGSSIALDGDTALVSAMGNNGNYYHQGAAYVFTRTNEVWNQQAKLTASDAMDVSLLGSSLALEGDTALIGASGDQNSQGSAYLFTHTSGVWRQQQKLTASDGAVFQRFGSAVGLSGGTTLIGAIAGNGAVPNAGAAYVFTINPQHLIWLPFISKLSDQ